MNDYNEINLIDYIKVLIKRRKMIFFITCVVLLITATTFLAPKKSLYEASAIIEVGAVFGNTLEEKAYTVAILQTESQAKYFLEKLYPDTPINKTRINHFLQNLTINHDATKNDTLTTAVLIEIAYKDTNPEVAKRTVETIAEGIVSDHKIKFDKALEKQDKQVEQKKEELKKAEGYLTELNKTIEQLQKLQYSPAYAEAQGRSMPGYIATQNELRAKTIALQQEITNSEFQKTDSAPTTIISKPYLPETPIKAPARQKAAIITAGLALGLLLGVCIAFAAEWWSANKNKLV